MPANGNRGALWVLFMVVLALGLFYVSHDGTAEEVFPAPPGSAVSAPP